MLRSGAYKVIFDGSGQSRTVESSYDIRASLAVRFVPDLSWGMCQSVLVLRLSVGRFSRLGPVDVESIASIHRPRQVRTREPNARAQAPTQQPCGPTGTTGTKGVY